MIIYRITKKQKKMEILIKMVKPPSYCVPRDRESRCTKSCTHDTVSWSPINLDIGEGIIGVTSEQGDDRALAEFVIFVIDHHLFKWPAAHLDKGQRAPLFPEAYLASFLLACEVDAKADDSISLVSWFLFSLFTPGNISRFTRIRSALTDWSDEILSGLKWWLGLLHRRYCQDHCFFSRGVDRFRSWCDSFFFIPLQA